MNDDEERLKRLPLAGPGAGLDARMDRLFATAIGREAKGWRIRLRYAVAASVLSAAAGAAIAALAMREPAPNPVQYVYVERPSSVIQRPIFPARSNPFDLSRAPIPVLLDSQWKSIVVPPVGDPGPKSQQTQNAPSV